MTSSKSIPWLRIGAESVAIVVSILLAFAIDAWWQERVERKALIEYLLHFQNEVITNEEQLDTHLGLIAGDLVALHKVFLMIADPDQGALPESFNHDLGNALYVRSPTVGMRAYYNLANSGYLRLVSNAQLEGVINEYKTSIDFLNANYAFSNSSYLEYILPVIDPYATLSNFGWQQYENHVAPDGENTGVTPRAPFSLDAAGLRSQAVWNALFHWKTIKIDESRALSNMKRQGHNLRELLRTEIEYQNQ